MVCPWRRGALAELHAHLLSPTPWLLHLPGLSGNSPLTSSSRSLLSRVPWGKPGFGGGSGSGSGFSSSCGEYIGSPPQHRKSPVGEKARRGRFPSLGPPGVWIQGVGLYMETPEGNLLPSSLCLPTTECGCWRLLCGPCLPAGCPRGGGRSLPSPVAPFPKLTLAKQVLQCPLESNDPAPPHHLPGETSWF